MNNIFSYIIIIIFLCICIFFVNKFYWTNKKLIEKFEEIEKKDMTKFDRFNKIIKGFENNRSTKPSPNELHALYDHFYDTNKYDEDDVEKLLNDDAKYHKAMKKFHEKYGKVKDVNKNITPKKQMKESNDIQQAEEDKESGSILVKKSLAKLLPNEKISSEKIDFLVYKLKKFNNDVKLLEEYITGDEEYNVFIKKRIDEEKSNHKANDESKDSQNMSFKIKKPNLGKKTLMEQVKEEEEKTYTCQDLEDEHMLSNLMSNRNLDELKYACNSSKNKHSTVKDGESMVLLPELKWSVPQERPEVCRISGKKNKVQYSIEQTSLIGTLLDAASDTQVGSIMPKFSFKQEDL